MYEIKTRRIRQCRRWKQATCCRGKERAARFFILQRLFMLSWCGFLFAFDLNVSEVSHTCSSQYNEFHSPLNRIIIIIIIIITSICTIIFIRVFYSRTPLWQSTLNQACMRVEFIYSTRSSWHSQVHVHFTWNNPTWDWSRTPSSHSFEYLHPRVSGERAHTHTWVISCVVGGLGDLAPTSTNMKCVLGMWADGNGRAHCSTPRVITVTSLNTQHYRGLVIKAKRKHLTRLHVQLQRHLTAVQPHSDIHTDEQTVRQTTRWMDRQTERPRLLPRTERNTT